LVTIQAEIRSGAYYDSAVLMQLQRSLAGLPGVQDAGVVMGTDSNKELLAHIDLLCPQAQTAKPDDLVIVVRAENDQTGLDALGKVDELLSRRKGGMEQEYRPRSLETATQMLPDAAWVMVSVAGRYAAGVAREALRLGKHVFLFSDNVSVEEEIALKQKSAELGLLVMGPDCGTALIGGMGLGFANKVQKGNIGVVAAAGTGLQHVTARIQQLGGGITHGIGTGGRDLSEKVGAVTFRQAIDLLSRDPETKVIVLVSKPPAPRVADEMLKAARKAGKPVVVSFIARPLATPQMDNLWFARGLDHAAELAVELATNLPGLSGDVDLNPERFAPGQRYLRGLFSGGTLAYEAQHILAGYLPRVYANAPINKELKLPNSFVSQEHSIVDLGEDEFTVGRLHPMMDNELRIRRILEEAAYPDVAVILLDVVIGFGSHPDPASELAPAIVQAKEIAAAGGRTLEVVAVVCGTEDDPQGLSSQVEQLKAAGAWVSPSNEETMRYVGRLLRALDPGAAQTTEMKPVDLASLQKPLAAINIGLESFAENLTAQGAPALQVDWRPPAGGNERLMALLEKMKQH
jgi:FdrA protein